MRYLPLIAASAGLAFALGTPAKAQDAEAGAQVFKQCQACHKVGEGARNGIGPQLNGVMTRKPGSAADYNYSSNFADWSSDKEEWDDELMSTWLEDPRGTVEGTKMAYAGVKDEEKLANVIAYLKTFNEDGTTAE